MVMSTVHNKIAYDFTTNKRLLDNLDREEQVLKEKQNKI